MSIKKILIIFMTIAVLLSILLFAFLSNKYVSDYFSDYINETYDENALNVVEYGRYVLTQGHQPRSILNSYIIDPIYYVEIYDEYEVLVTNSGKMSKNFVFDNETMLIDTFDIEQEGNIIGSALITREISTESTVTNQLFRNALFTGGMISFLVTIALIGLLLVFIIKYISKNISGVAAYANEDKREKQDYKISELNTIADAITQYRIALAQKQRVKKQKIDQLMHETKTPLTVMKSQLEGINDGMIRADKERIKSLIDGVDHLNLALKDIADVVEGAPKKRAVKLDDMDYSEQLEKIINSLTTKFNNKGINVVYEKDRFDIKTNKAMLDKAIYNLLMNSYKYTQSGSVCVVTDNQRKTLKISDTGIGIDKKDLSHIFEPYYRGKGADGINGEGLGLSIVKEILQSLNADVVVKSEAGKFTHFKISF